MGGGIALCLYITLVYLVHPLCTLLLIPLFFYFISWFNQFLVYKYLTASLYDKLDVALYREIVKQGKMYGNLGMWAIMGEYSAGNYEAVITACEQRLNDPRSEKYHYWFVIKLANVYFDMGDDERLDRTCRAYQALLASMPPRRSRKLERRARRMEFFAAYLAHDYDHCRSILMEKVPKEPPLLQMGLCYRKARLHLALGETEEARACFEQVVQTAPQINYAMLSAHALEAMERGEAYGASLVLPESDEVFVPYREPTKAKKAVAICSRIVVIVGTVLAVIGGALVLYGEYQDWKYKKEYQAYVEQLELAIEQDYDGVEILETFDLEVDGQTVDSMFLCRSEEALLFGTVYRYEGEQDFYCQYHAKMSVESLKDPIPIWSNGRFDCVVTDYHGIYHFCTTKNICPDNIQYQCRVTVDGVTVEFFLTNVEKSPNT